MPPPKAASEPASEGAFAEVYDALYRDDEFCAARADFLCAAFDATGVNREARLLDAGCGTGSQSVALLDRGRRVVALDADPLMLAAARQKQSNLPLILGDLRRPPFAPAFGGILCLESPLAYLLDDADLRLALRGFRQVLTPRGCLVIDCFDYPAFFGAAPARSRSASYHLAEKTVSVAESHSFDTATRIWEMVQRFTVSDEAGTRQFVARHRLRMRSGDEYVSALAEAGFETRELLANYPGLPERLRSERRVIAIALAR